MGNRPYRSQVREAAAAATKAEIRAAASRLFVARGYAAVSLREVAAEAGVGQRTLYAAYASKFDLFHHTLDVATVGDEAPVAVRDRPGMTDPLTDPDPTAALTAMVDYGIDLLERAGDLIWTGVEAAGADANMRELAEAGRRETKLVMQRFTARLAELGALRSGLGADDAADVLYALTSPHTFHLLRRDCGWSRHRYREWLQATSLEQLLGAGTPTEGGTTI